MATSVATSMAAAIAPTAFTVRSRGNQLRRSSQKAHPTDVYFGGTAPQLLHGCTAPSERRGEAGTSTSRGSRLRAAPDTFLSMEEAGLVEMAGLDMHERFLARLTVSSLNLLRVIAEQEGVTIEELNAGKVCDWFVKDKERRKQDKESAVLKWDDIPSL